MKKFGRYLFAGSLFCVGSFLTACSFTPNNSPLNQDTGHVANIDGLWADHAGMLSTFCNGIFETHAPDTDEKLAEGNYSFIEPRKLEIEIHSIVRGTISKVACQVSPDNTILSCTAPNGSNFWLKRHI